MAAIFQIRRGTTNVSLTEGELYLHQGSGSLQFGSGSSQYNVLTLNAPVKGDINLIGNITASNAYFSGDVAISGNLFLGNNSSDNIAALGVFTTNLNPGTTNAYDVGSVTSNWRNVYATSISGAIAATNGIVSGSSQIISILSSLNTFSASVLTETASLETRAATLGTYTASIETRFTTLGTLTGSNAIRLTNLESKSSSVDTRLTTLGNVTSSLETRMTTLANVTSSIHSYTSSLKTALSLSGTDVTVLGNLTVNGTTTQINSTQVNIAENIIELNYGGSQTTSGIITKDATGGSTISGSLLWDATNDYWKAGKLGSEAKILLASGDSVISASSQIDLTQTTNYTSVFNALANITGSLISTASSHETRLGVIGTYTSSLETRLSAIATETASLETRATTLGNLTSSVLTQLSTLGTYTGSVETRFNTIQSLTSSNLVRLSNLETATGSYNTRFTALEQVTSSLQSATGSLFLSASRMTSSIFSHEGRITYLEGIAFGGIDLSAQFSALQQVTSSLNSYTSSANVRFSNIEAATSSYETKGRGIVSGSSQILGGSGVWSGSAQLPNGVISGSSQVDGTAITNKSITIAGTSVSLGGSITIATILQGTGVVSGSSQILGGSGVASGSYETTGRSIVSSSAQIVPLLPAGVVSGSSQVITANSITLATHTSGDYVASLVQGTGVTITNNSGENTTPTIAIGQAVGTSANVQFASIGVGTTASGTAGEIRATGDITAYYSSDIRLKENIIRIPNALEKVNQISGNTYDWKEGYDEVHSHKGNDVGVIAQEVEAILPQIVTNRDTGFKAVQYEKIIPLLIEAIKELSAKVDRLENK